MRRQRGLPRAESSGFTVIELVIVVVIIAIISAIAIPSLFEAYKRVVAVPFAKHFAVEPGPGMNTKAPYAEWFHPGAKTLIRPYVGRRLKLICEGAAAELEGWRKLKGELAALPPTSDNGELVKRIGILEATDRGLAYWEAAATDGGKSCAEAKEVARKLDLLPAESPGSPGGPDAAGPK